MISSLFVCWTFDNVELPLVAAIPEPVPFDWEALRAVGDLVVGGEEVGSCVVLEAGCVHVCPIKSVAFRLFDEFLEQTLWREKRL